MEAARLQCARERTKRALSARRSRGAESSCTYCGRSFPPGRLEMHMVGCHKRSRARRRASVGGGLAASAPPRPHTCRADSPTRAGLGLQARTEAQLSPAAWARLQQVRQEMAAEAEQPAEPPAEPREAVRAHLAESQAELQAALDEGLAATERQHLAEAQLLELGAQLRVAREQKEALQAELKQAKDEAAASLAWSQQLEAQLFETGGSLKQAQDSGARAKERLAALEAEAPGEQLRATRLKLKQTRSQWAHGVSEAARKLSLSQLVMRVAAAEQEGRYRWQPVDLT